MAEKFLTHIYKIMEDPILISVPKFPNNEKVKTVNKTHKESIEEITTNKVPDLKYYMSLLKKKAETLKDNTNTFQSRFNSLKNTIDDIAEVKDLISKKEQTLKECSEINDRLKEKYDNETKRVQDYYKERQAKYNEFFDIKKAEIE